MSREVQLTMVRKVFRPNKRKVLALNRRLEEYFKLVNWYLKFSSTSKTFLHRNGYERAKQPFNLNRSDSDSEILCSLSPELFKRVVEKPEKI